MAVVCGFAAVGGSDRSCVRGSSAGRPRLLGVDLLLGGRSRRVLALLGGLVPCCGRQWPNPLTRLPVSAVSWRELP